MIYGYVRKLNKKESLDEQIKEIKANYPKATIIEEKNVSNARPKLKFMLNKATEGDIIVFSSLERFGIELEELYNVTQSLKEVNQIMSTYVGIVRSNLRLDRAWDRLDILYEETERLFKQSKASKEICELRNLINVGYLIMRQAKERHESRGLHYSIDYPPVKNKNN